MENNYNILMSVNISTSAPVNNTPPPNTRKDTMLALKEALLARGGVYNGDDAYVCFKRPLEMGGKPEVENAFLTSHPDYQRIDGVIKRCLKEGAYVEFSIQMNPSKPVKFQPQFVGPMIHKLKNEMSSRSRREILTDIIIPRFIDHIMNHPNEEKRRKMQETMAERLSPAEIDMVINERKLPSWLGVYFKKRTSTLLPSFDDLVIMPQDLVTKIINEGDKTAVEKVSVDGSLPESSFYIPEYWDKRLHGNKKSKSYMPDVIGLMAIRNPEELKDRLSISDAELKKITPRDKKNHNPQMTFISGLRMRAPEYFFKLEGAEDSTDFMTPKEARQLLQAMFNDPNATRTITVDEFIDPATRKQVVRKEYNFVRPHFCAAVARNQEQKKILKSRGASDKQIRLMQLGQNPFKKTSIHHIKPICTGGHPYNRQNLSIMDETLHRLYHSEWLDKQYLKKQTGVPLPIKLINFTPGVFDHVAAMKYYGIERDKSGRNNKLALTLIRNDGGFKR